MELRNGNLLSHCLKILLFEKTFLLHFHIFNETHNLTYLNKCAKIILQTCSHSLFIPKFCILQILRVEGVQLFLYTYLLSSNKKLPKREHHFNCYLTTDCVRKRTGENKKTKNNIIKIKYPAKSQRGIKSQSIKG